MTRIPILTLALLVFAGCGGGGGAPAPAPMVRSNKDEIQERRDEIKALGDVPSDASSEVPKLLRATDDPDPEVRWRAEFALGRVDARGLKALVEAFQDPSPKIRVAAAGVLGPMGKKARSAVPALLRAAEAKRKSVRTWSV